MTRSPGRRLAIVLLVGYLATVAGAAMVIPVSPVCTQYDMVAAIPAAPLVNLAGGFVIFALTVAGVREGVVAGILALPIMALLSGAFVWATRAAWRGTASGGPVTVALGIFAVILAVMSGIASFAFCLSMSV